MSFIKRDNLVKGTFYPPEETGNGITMIKNAGSRDIVCILVHAWLAASNEMKFIERNLAEHDFVVMNIQLKGHGTKPEDLLNYKLGDWVNQLDDAVTIAERDFSKIFIIGQCGGGNIVLNFLDQYRGNKIKGLILAGVPYFFTKEASYLARVFNKIYRWILKPLESVIHPFYMNNKLMKFNIYSNEMVPWDGYNELWPVYSMGEGAELVRTTSRIDLSKIKIRSMIIHYQNDCLYSVKHAVHLYENLNAENYRQNILEILKTDYDGPIAGHKVFNNLSIHEYLFPRVRNFILDTVTGAGLKTMNNEQ